VFHPSLNKLHLEHSDRPRDFCGAQVVLGEEVQASQSFASYLEKVHQRPMGK